MAVALYARVSTPRQAEKDLSIPDQLRQMREYCKAHNLPVAYEYIESGATSFAGLPWWRLVGFLRMLDFLSSNVVQRRWSAAVCCGGVKPFG